MITAIRVQRRRFRYFVAMDAEHGWQFWVDRGGTFTDIVARRPDGSLLTAKLLSENPEHYTDAAAEGIRRILARNTDYRSGRFVIDAIKMGTTVATNALLERQGSPTALLVSAGFADALRIGYQNRPDIFALDIRKPEPLYKQVVEIDERIAADGSVLRPLDMSAARAALQACKDDGIRSIAVCLMHGYRFSGHEDVLGRIAGDMGFDHVSVSHDVEALIKFVSRAETTLADAYLTPVLQGYIDRLQHALAQVGDTRRLLFMQSNGGLIDANRFRGKDSVLSGPAGGVVGMAQAAQAVGLKKLVGFDMGGTSTDVSAYSGDYERSVDSEVAGMRLRAPMMRIHTIAAGGGSILRFADGRYQVGPASAGADPGPVCYRRGGPLTVTDANVLMGRLVPEYFPKVFGAQADQALDAAAVRAGFDSLADTINGESGEGSDVVSPEQVAAGFVSIAVEGMANAIRKITIERGEDVRDFTLCCFGGAGGQHACRVADVLDMQHIWLHPMAGVLSAYGMGLANLRVERQQSIDVTLDDEQIDAIDARIATLRADCEHELAEQDVAPQNRQLSVSFGIKVRGTDTVMAVDAGTASAVRDAFAAAYAERFGAALQSDDLVIATIRVAAIGQEQRFDEPQLDITQDGLPVTSSQMWVGDQWKSVPVFLREELGAGARIDGPAILIEPTATTVIESGWHGVVGTTGHLLLSKVTSSVQAATPDTTGGHPDPVRLEVFNRLFMHIAEQMGVVLQNTAVSVNIRERLDFSCALFDASGRLVSNAPHMPVHLGSMGESVRSVITDSAGALREGDAVMLNSPYNGGTHLPDITVVTPWFGDKSRPQFFLASRAHHADIGGVSPGSMPADSRHIDHEGVLIDNVFLVRQGELQLAATRNLLGTAKHPARNVEQNIADLQAQLAANQQGIRQLEKATSRYGIETVQSYLRHVRENAAASVRRLIGTLHDGHFEYELDSGEKICVSVAVDSDLQRARIDFSGTSKQASNNFNAPEAVTRAAVLYVFRSLITDDIPMNEGCLEPLDIVIPQGSLLSPVYPAAVVAGNVETSQCVTDALFGALGALAASQGTMNNLSFGNERFQYYETIAGGAGAGPGWHGADAVQTHMTNSRLTDPEVLELVFPVRLESFAVRTGSGGKGLWHGGDGVIREIRFLESVDASILSNHRRIAPFGLDGGRSGSKGRNRVVRSGERAEKVAATASLTLNAGDRLVIETPGGGGFGKPKS